MPLTDEVMKILKEQTYIYKLSRMDILELIIVNQLIMKKVLIEHYKEWVLMMIKR